MWDSIGVYMAPAEARHIVPLGGFTWTVSNGFKKVWEAKPIKDTSCKHPTVYFVTHVYIQAEILKQIELNQTSLKLSM